MPDNNAHTAAGPIGPVTEKAKTPDNLWGVFFVNAAHAICALLVDDKFETAEAELHKLDVYAIPVVAEVAILMFRMRPQESYKFRMFMFFYTVSCPKTPPGEAVAALATLAATHARTVLPAVRPKRTKN